MFAGTMKAILERQIQRQQTLGYPQPRQKTRPTFRLPDETPRSTNVDDVIIDKTNILLIGPTGSGTNIQVKVFTCLANQLILPLKRSSLIYKLYI